MFLGTVKVMPVSNFIAVLVCGVWKGKFHAIFSRTGCESLLLCGNAIGCMGPELHWTRAEDVAFGFPTNVKGYRVTTPGQVWVLPEWPALFVLTLTSESVVALDVKAE